jgi:hypothetical protein
MLSEIIYTNELNNLDIREFKINLNSLVDSKKVFDKNIILNQKINIFIENLQQLLNKNGFVIIRNFGTDLDSFIILNFLLSKEIYFSERMNTSLHTFQIKLKSNALSESLYNHGFHTDFLFQDTIPDCVSLQCLIKDPKYPYLGRNYIVDTKKLFLNMMTKFSLTEEYLLNLKLPYTFGKKIIWVKVFSKEDTRISIKIHLSTIDLSKLKKEHFFENVSIIELLNQLGLNLSIDFVLDQGDIVIFSNKYAMHKRGEASLDIKNINNYKSRKMNSIRFFKKYE